jgi:DNA-directed RNA polymerase subunit beta'
LGLYYFTNVRRSTPENKVKGEGLAFYSAEEAIIAYNEGKADLHAWVKVKTIVREGKELKTKLIETTVGRILFNQVVPENVGFIDKLLTKRALKDVIGDIIDLTDVPTTVKFLDKIKDIGFTSAFKGGLSFNIGDVIIPVEKDTILNKAQLDVDDVQDKYSMGFITDR